MKIGVISIIMVMLIASYVNISYAPESLRFMVHVNVSCEEKDVKASIESYIKRELRSLQDVAFVSADAENYPHLFLLNFIAVTGTYKATGQKTGNIAVAYQFLEKISSNRIKNNYISKETWKSLEGIRNLIHLYHTSGVVTDDTEDLPDICKQLIVNFDTNVLEPVRIAVQVGRELGRKFIHENPSPQ